MGLPMTNGNQFWGYMFELFDKSIQETTSCATTMDGLTVTDPCKLRTDSICSGTDSET